MANTKKTNKYGTKKIAVLNANEVKTAIKVLTDSIVEAHKENFEALILAGISPRGIEVANRIFNELKQRHSKLPSLGTIDISMHRDDLALRTKMSPIKPTKLPIDIENRTIIIIDDVVFTGRTCRAAMDAIQSFGRPARIEFAVLIDRGHRELPICPNYVGCVLHTESNQRIRVQFKKVDGTIDSVYMIS